MLSTIAEFCILILTSNFIYLKINISSIEFISLHLKTMLPIFSLFGLIKYCPVCHSEESHGSSLNYFFLSYITPNQYMDPVCPAFKIIQEYDHFSPSWPWKPYP